MVNGKKLPPINKRSSKKRTNNERRVNIILSAMPYHMENCPGKIEHIVCKRI